MTTSQPPGISRRRFLGHTASLCGAVGLLGPTLVRAASAGDPLPAGASPPALPLEHFPSRLHAFVWRNWQLVPLDRLARVVDASPADLERIGHAMGLQGPPPITTGQQQRSYITVIKRNWHLLPYDQLLTLLGWEAEQLAYTLREDDFLFVKLGNLKPACEPLRYQPPDAATRAREEQIAKTVREYFPAGVGTAGKPLFEFVSALSQPPASLPPPAAADHLRFCYSYFALYGDPLEDGADPYPDGLLARLAAVGVNGVWLHAVLYKLAPFPWDPALSAGSERRLANLQALARRARERGIRVFLYLNEPRAMPLRFFESHPQLKGPVEGGYAALCTSVPEVQRYLRSALEHVCRAAPDLGGFFSISASENLTHCWSHGGGVHCPRCRERSPAQVVAEVNRCFADGIRAARHPARLLVWDWGWGDDWAPDAIRELPAEASLMSVSEWRLPIDRGGVQTEVGEYSLSAIGPGPRSQRHWKLAQERGLPAVAKVQAGNCWELSAIPWVPAVENAARHAENLHRLGVKDLMLGWTLGGYPSPNLEVVTETLAGGSAAVALQKVAERRFGTVAAPLMVEAWKRWSEAYREFPFHIGVVYSGPQQLGPANLLWTAPTRYAATMVGFPYDDLDAWRAVYPPEIFMGQFQRVAEGFFAGLRQLTLALEPMRDRLTPDQQRAVADECRMAQAAALHFQSVACQVGFVRTRNASAPEAPVLRRILQDEIQHARQLYALQTADSRIGFEASNQYFYVPLDLVEKVLNCQDLLDRWLPSLEKKSPSKVPGVVISHSPQASGLYIGSPSLAVLPNGHLVASHDFFGPQSREHERARSLVFRSADRGRTWTRVAEIHGAFWSSLFFHRGALYLLGPDRHHGNVLIRRSTDEGVTWTEPTDARSGLLRADGEYHCAPVPVLEHAGRLWRAMERRVPPVAWGINYRAGVLSAPVDADLLNADRWTASEFLPSDRAWNNQDMGAWLEGNVVVDPEGQLVNILRVQTRSPDEKAALVGISSDGLRSTFDPTTGFVDFPGGAKKFAIRFDPISRHYWALATIVHPRHRADNPGSIRNTLALTRSANLRQWEVRAILLYHPDVKFHGFQYPDWQFDGEDLIAVVRTAYEDGLGGARNQHDANFLTFHRFPRFRELTIDVSRDGTPTADSTPSR